MKIHCKILSSPDVNEFVELINIFREVFEVEAPAMAGRDYLQSLLCKPDFLVMVAKEGDKVVGGLTAYILHRYYAEKPIAYVYDVGVHPHYQRKGIGNKLLNYFLEYCKEQGFEEAFVQAEAGDEGAVSFYRAGDVSGEMNAIQFSYEFGSMKF